MKTCHRNIKRWFRFARYFEALTDLTCWFGSQLYSVRLRLVQTTTAQMLTDNDMIFNTHSSFKCPSETNWTACDATCQFSTLYGLESQHDFIYCLSASCICWSKQSSVRKPLAFFSRGQGQLHLSVTEQQRAGSHALYTAPLWDYDRFMRCRQELMNIFFHKARVILPTKYPPAPTDKIYQNTSRKTTSTQL